jgi:hypothetical protein
LIDGSLIKRVRVVLHVAHFFRGAHQVIYQAMLDLDDNEGRVDIVMVSDQLTLRGDMEKVTEDDDLEQCVNAVPTAANYMSYAELVIEKAIIRQGVEHATEFIRDAYSNHFTAYELVGRLDKAVVALQHASVAGREEAEEDAGFVPLPGGMAPAAFRGIAGTIVGLIAENTEACQEAIVLQLLTAFGNMIGGRAHWIESGKKHRCNLYLAIVGPTGCGKGMAWEAVQWLMERCNPQWKAKPVLESMTSGEGVIKEIKELGGSVLAVEEELGQVLGNIAREGNSLSGILRKAWGNTYLRNPTKNESVSVDNAYLSIIGHVTPEELKLKLRSQDFSNGLVNRFAYAGAYLARLLPRGGDFELIENLLSPHLKRMFQAADYGLTNTGMDRPFHRDREAEALFHSRYKGLRVRAPGPYGQATARGAPIVMRLAVIYAILDSSPEVTRSHLESALACWDYCDQTAQSLFGNAPADIEGEQVMKVLREETAKNGMTKTEINRKAFGGRKASQTLDSILSVLNHGGSICVHPVNKGKNGCKLWQAT